MRRAAKKLVPFCLLAMLLVSACAGGPEQGAYVHQIDEFNRASPNFAKEPENIDSVTICYNKFGTKPEIVARMAKEECARFNKKAEFSRQSLTVCPLFTPAAAIYDCLNQNR